VIGDNDGIPERFSGDVLRERCEALSCSQAVVRRELPDGAARVDRYLELVNADRANDDTPTFLYEFVRLGENYEDIITEYQGFACECLLSVNREIICEV